MRVTRIWSLALAAAILACGIPRPALGQGTGDPYYEFLMSRRLEGQGDANGALAALQRAALADPRSASIRSEIAGFQLRHNRAAEAEAAAREALALDADDAEAHRVLGLVYAAKADVGGRVQPAQIASDIKEALSHLEIAVASPAAASDINLFYTIGRLYLRNGDGEKAAQALARVVSLNPDSAQARLTLAQALMVNHDTDGAIETLEAIIDDEPRVGAALGQYLEQAGRFKDAAASYGKALAVAPMNRELKFRRMAALFSAKDFTQAASLAAEAQVQFPDDQRFPRLQARALFETGAKARAIELLEPVARANAADATTQFELANMYSDTGRAADAERTVRQLITVAPTNADALNYLGYLLANNGQQLDEAIRLVRRALELEPGNPSYLDSLGWAYFRKGDTGEAEKYLVPAAEQLPRNSIIQDHLGDVLARRGKWQDAIASWTRALGGDTGDIDRAAIQTKIKNAQSRTR